MPDVTITIPAALVGEVAALLGSEAKRLLYIIDLDVTSPTADEIRGLKLRDFARGLNQIRNDILAARIPVPAGACRNCRYPAGTNNHCPICAIEPAAPSPRTEGPPDADAR